MPSEGHSLTTGAASIARRRAIVIASIVVAVVCAAVAIGVWLYARGGGPLPEWAGGLRPDDVVLRPSSRAESVLRALRLAGYQRAAVGDADGTVVVRVEAPSVGTAADVALSWQTGLAAASAAYPEADTIVVQVFAPAQPLLEVTAPAEVVRTAVAADDAAALRRACRFRYLSELTGG